MMMICEYSQLLDLQLKIRAVTWYSHCSCIGIFLLLGIKVDDQCAYTLNYLGLVGSGNDAKP